MIGCVEMVYDMEKALGFIMENGSVMDTYKVEYLLDLGRDDKIPLEFFSRYQNKDGGFPLEFKEGKPSSIGTTAMILPWFFHLDVTYAGSYKRCINYLMESQKPDGFWDEDQRIGSMGPPEQLEPGILSTKLFLTGLASNLLLNYDINEYSAKKGVNYMENFRRGDGSFEGLPITNWMMFSLYSQRGDDEKADALMPFLETDTPEDPKYLVMQIDCIWMANRENHIAEGILDRLEKMQQDDGSWKTSDGKRFYAQATAEIIRIMHTWGRE